MGKWVFKSRVLHDQSAYDAGQEVPGLILEHMKKLGVAKQLEEALPASKEPSVKSDVAKAEAAKKYEK